MKRLLLLMLCLLFLSACDSKNDNYIKKFSSTVNNYDSYYLEGVMKIHNDEESFIYDINVSYLRKNYYKVSMVNRNNNKEQIILKNNAGLYVITPALNKSYKFDSNWPDNSSQAYILSSIIKDLTSDKKSSFTIKDDKIILKSLVDFPNNSNLVYQKVTISKDMKPIKIVIFDKKDNKKIEVDYKKVKFGKKFSKNDFVLDNYISDSKCENDCDKDVMGKIDNAILPMYMPVNTFLNSSEIVSTDGISRAILTYTGEKNFVIVEQKANKINDLEILPVFGEPVMINDTLGALSNNSLSWNSDDMDYYLASNDLSVEELVSVASSLGNYSSIIATK